MLIPIKRVGRRPNNKSNISTKEKMKKKRRKAFDYEAMKFKEQWKPQLLEGQT